LALPDLTTRLSNTDQLLVRSGMEIGRLLAAMCKDGDTVSGNLPPQVLFLSRLLSVEPQKGVLRLAYSDHKPVNSAVLQARSLTLRCNHRGAQFAFAAATPRHAAHGGAPCIECGLPTAILGMQQRRAALQSAGGFPFAKHQTPWQEIQRGLVAQLDEGMVLKSAVNYRDIAHRGMPRDNH